MNYFDDFDPTPLINSALATLPNLVAALGILVVAAILVRTTRPAIRKALQSGRLAPGLVDLLANNVYGLLVFTIAVLMAAQQIGINVTAALAGMGVAGLAVGLAAQDSLANTIAGFLIFWDKPFKVGDYVSVEDRYGEVIEITLRTTRIKTRNNTYVVIPNKEIIDDVLVNHSMYGETRIDVPVGIAYKEDIGAARDALLDAAGELDGILEDPAPKVVVTGLGASSIDLELRVWTREADTERPIYFRAVEAAKHALDDAGIEIPFPHMQLFVENVESPVWEGLSATVNAEEAIT